MQAALRLARAYTGRKKYVKFEGHYHGWFDSVLISQHPAADRNADDLRGVLETAGQAESVLDDVVVIPWNDLEAVETVFDRGYV